MALHVPKTLPLITQKKGRCTLYQLGRFELLYNMPKRLHILIKERRLESTGQATMLCWMPGWMIPFENSL